VRAECGRKLRNGDLMGTGIIVGISGGLEDSHHDPAAALFVDGVLVGAEEEERSVRLKGAPGMLPRHALGSILKAAGIAPNDIETVVLARRKTRDAADRLADWLRFRFGCDPVVELADHHEAHAHSAEAFSGFDRSLVLTLDLSGDKKAGTVWLADGGKLQLLESFERPHSLGLLFAVICQYLGFEYNRDEFKVLALSALGKPLRDIRRFVSAGAGTVHLDTRILSPEYTLEQAPRRQERLWSPWLESELGTRPRLATEALSQEHFDIAASLQDCMETVVCDIVEHHVRTTGIRRLCFSGGVALNCKLNGVLGRLQCLDELYTPPWPSDAGTAIGGPIACGFCPRPSIPEATSALAYQGREYAEEEIRSLLAAVGAGYERPDSIAERAADAIACGKATGWFQGRMEFGPRALGCRSILGLASCPDVSKRISQEIKGRESFRPLAPAVLTEDFDILFEDKRGSPFMSQALVCKRPDQLAGACHLDQTSRAQVVATELSLGSVLSEMKKRTGLGAVINTSFNVRGKPIVKTPYEAVAAFFSSPIDCMAIGPYWLTKDQP